MSARLLFDIETDGLLDTCSKLHCISIINLDSPDTTDLYHGDSLKEGLERLSEASLLVGHNIQGFDLPALQMLYKSFQSKAEVFDTLIASRVIWSDIKSIDLTSKRVTGKLIGSHSLEAWGHRLGEHKDKSPVSWEYYTDEMGVYCKQDTRVNLKLYDLIVSKNYSKECLDLEHKFASIIRKQENHGFLFDVSAAEELYKKLLKKRENIKEKLQKVFPPDKQTMKTPQYWLAGKLLSGEKQRFDTKGDAKKAGWKDREIEKGPLRIKEEPFNPGSRTQIYKRLKELYGWKPTKFAPAGSPQIDDEVLMELPWQEAKVLAGYFLLNKRIGQIAEGDNAWLKLYQRDSRIRGSVITNGAVTGRCTHNSPNIAQVPKAKRKVPYGIACRSLFKVPEGRSLVGCDASGLELRCLAHYMFPWDQGEYVKVILVGDVHDTNMRALEIDDRDDSKTFIYAYCYGAGDPKLGTIVSDEVDEKKLRAIGGNLRGTFERNIPALGRLTESVKRACGYEKTVGRSGRVFWRLNKSAEKKHLKGIDGRVLPVRGAHSALNTLLQSAGAVIMKKALCILWDRLLELELIPHDDFMFVANIHDEFQIECKTEYAELIGKEAVRAIQDAGKYFNFRCPLDGEYKIGRNWAETH